MKKKNETELIHIFTIVIDDSDHKIPGTVTHCLNSNTYSMNRITKITTKKSVYKNHSIQWMLNFLKVTTHTHGSRYPWVCAYVCVCVCVPLHQMVIVVIHQKANLIESKQKAKKETMTNWESKDENWSKKLFAQRSPGYVSTGQLAYRAPVFLSSNLRLTLIPLATSFMRPVHSGSLKFQLAALPDSYEKRERERRERTWAQIIHVHTISLRHKNQFQKKKKNRSLCHLQNCHFSNAKHILWHFISFTLRNRIENRVHKIDVYKHRHDEEEIHQK